MATSLAWRDIRREDFKALRCSDKAGTTRRQILANVLGIDKPDDPCRAIELDLFLFVLKFGQDCELHDDQVSALLSVVKDVHEKSMTERLTLDNSFTFFKNVLLKHSVHRPPFSVGLFSVNQVAKITDWMVDTYYRHYKLYQYAFTNRVTMSVTTRHVGEIVEAPPKLRPLEEAITEEEHNKIVEAEQRKKEEEEKQALEARLKAEEDERQQKIKEAYEAAIPDEITQRVQAAVEREVALLRERMEKQFLEQKAQIEAKIAEMEGQKEGE